MNASFAFQRFLEPDVMVFVMVMVIVVASIFSGMVISIVKAMRGGDIKKDREMLKRQGESLDELWAGMDRMEERINNLETILLHRSEHKL